MAILSKWKHLALIMGAITFFSTAIFAYTDTEQPRDMQVIDTVLCDMVTCHYEDNNRPLLVGKAPRHVYFNPTPYKSNLAETLKPLHRKNIWRLMSNEERLKAQEAVTHIMLRGEKPNAFINYRPQDHRIHLVTVKPVRGDKDFYRARMATQLWIPGYSQDGNFAIVQIDTKSLFHPGVGTYLLKKQGDKWKILYRAFMTFA